MDSSRGDSSNFLRALRPLAEGQTFQDNDSLEFARPIEDEDIFGIGLEEAPKLVACDDHGSERQTAGLDAEQNPGAQSSGASSRLVQLKQRIKDAALARGIVPKPFKCDKDKRGLICMDENEEPDEPVPPARLIFQHAQSQRTKDDFGLYRGQKLKWDTYNSHLKKNICLKKRKLWDSFQCPADDYNEDEELVKGSGSEKDEGEREPADGEGEDAERSDGDASDETCDENDDVSAEE